MGTKYTSQTITGYNATPPADDGTETEANKGYWATIKDKLGDPVKTYADDINTAMATFADMDPLSKTAAYTTTTAEHLKTIECDGTFTITLGAVATMGKGYTVSIKNIGTGVVLVDGSGAETIDEVADFNLGPQEAITAQVDSGGGEYRIIAKTATGDAGDIKMWPTGTAPNGWLHMDGTAISRTTYSRLFAVIGETYGNGDASTTFNLPDARGNFVRFYDGAAGVDPDAATRTDRGDLTTGDNVGTKQADDYLAHTHIQQGGSVNLGSDGTKGGWGVEDGYTTARGVTQTSPTTGGNETRPVNIGFMGVIKY